MNKILIVLIWITYLNTTVYIGVLIGKLLWTLIYAFKVKNIAILSILNPLRLSTQI